MRAFEPLRLFLHLSQTLHFGRTSEQCRVSPSALSRSIRQLEKELNVTLFARDRRHVALTPEGQRLKTFTAELFARWDEFQRTTDDDARLRGSIALYCTVTASQSIVPEVLRRFRDRYPEVHITIETGYAGNALAMIENESIDVTIAALPDRLPHTLVVRALVKTPLLLVAPTTQCAVTELLTRRTYSWSDVPLIAPPFGLIRDMVERWLRTKRVKPNYYSEIASHEAILSLVALGCGVGVVPKLVLEKSALRKSVQPLMTRPSLGSLNVGACARRSSLQNPLVAALWDVMAA